MIPTDLLFFMIFLATISCLPVLLGMIKLLVIPTEVVELPSLISVLNEESPSTESFSLRAFFGMNPLWLEATTVAEKYVNGKWEEVDYYRDVFCRLGGFDPSEDSWMYGVGNTDIMDSIEEISEEEYNALIKEQTCN